jgi:hypothetical protein
MKASYCVLVFVISTALRTFPALGQSTVEERASDIDWERATSDGATTRLTAPTLNGFIDANSSELASTKLPVLAGRPDVVAAPPRLRSQTNSYTLAYTLPDAKLSILGTSVYLVRPDDQIFGQSGGQANRAFERSDDGSDLSFRKYGASYVLRISCAKIDDERCAKDDFLNKIADGLLVVGGQK